ncbi:MAG: tRNA uridine-5-carboxymethylaminomethyl(34) synthesis GTPase MnmE [Pseudomonadota bacterium]
MGDTIFAPATARGVSAIAVLRLSGPASWEAVAALTQKALPHPRMASLRWLLDASGERLDEALVLLFEPGRSATGERMAELHCHGARAVTEAVLQRLSSMPALRLAEPGEFTRRALENGRMDLAQAEGLDDLLHAETEAQRRQAMRVYSGHLSSKIAAWRGRLVTARSLLEASIDFSDEDIPDDLIPGVLVDIERLHAELSQHLVGATAAERIREGFEVALVGPPNAGKSTLLNRIAARDIAITSRIAGTTRDVLEVRLNLNGLPVTLLDTAGLRETEDEVERIGIRRTRDRAASADLRIALIPPGARPEDLGLDLTEEDLVVEAKADLVPTPPKDAVSGVTGEGVTELLDRATSRLSARAAGATDVIRIRHRRALEDGVRQLDHAIATLRSSAGRVELAAESLRLCCADLEAVLGHVDVEALLDTIFARFCLGK